MNVFLRQLLFSLVFLVWVPVLTVAQSVVTIPVEIVQGETFTTTIQSNPNPALLITPPTYGTAELIEQSTLTHILTYTPAPDFPIGEEDLIVVSRWETPWAPIEFRNYEITVLPAVVKANHDYATTEVDVPVSVDVLDNDVSSRDTFILVNVPLVNNGTAQIAPDGSSILFTPHPGFVGLTSFNYLVCDDEENCDNGTVTVYVSDPNASMSDTIDIFTKRNESQVVLVPDHLTLQAGPDNGTYVDTLDAPEYTPDTDFVGLDYLAFTAGAQETIVRINVLDYHVNAFAMDDEVHTVPDESVEFNVLDNDLLSLVNDPCNFQIVDGPLFGTVTGNDGQLTYTPNPGFTGLDWFTYSVLPSSSCAGLPETAKVYVFVSNYQPASSKYRMSTPKETPLIIGYNVPISNFDFEVTDQGELGQAVFLEGNVDTLINGIPVQGYNLILYIPDQGVSSGLDEFELVYCVRFAGGCSYQKTIKIEVDILDIVPEGPVCIGDCVWAGDTNFDGEVNMEDLLPLGVHMGELGSPRPDPDLSVWYGQYGDDWQEDYEAEGVNLKHLDTDGDSLITALDTFAISQFYGNAHAITPVQVPFNEYNILLQGDIFISPGDLVNLEMILGEENEPAVDIYGFTFPFQYDPDFIVPESVDIDYKGNSWLTYNSPILYMVRNNFNGLIESGFTRTSGFAASGKGGIGEVNFVVTDDIIVFKEDKEIIELTIGGGQGIGLDGDGRRVALNIPSVTLRIDLSEPETESTAIHPDQLKVFPNPARDFLNVHLNGGHEIERLTVHNLTGQEVFNSGSVFSRNLQLDLTNFPNGLYVITAHTGGAVVNKKFEVVR